MDESDWETIDAQVVENPPDGFITPLPDGMTTGTRVSGRQIIGGKVVLVGPLTITYFARYYIGGHEVDVRSLAPAVD